MSKRKFTAIYCITVTIPFLMLIFPLSEIGNRATPLVFGLPFSFFWAILWILITFTALLFIYQIDPANREEGDQ
ncbi:DUF3311 domain-containing protein [Jeotgalibacillus sp. S-D1]|uniref:DUF3311 domain-containing protein n=1 Tax=Jeotgalibacillus sp. S-D1 TaxID=2552189 RepID=UPI00105A5F78|nr:DUF3311 domain-containing protein [Jeotgalibacillus sp. S-D1]TDL32715.1 DUF3311 domain-containing protein [Jeotgalibacillus sp. S-D1]